MYYFEGSIPSALFIISIPPKWLTMEVKVKLGILISLVTALTRKINQVLIPMSSVLATLVGEVPFRLFITASIFSKRVLQPTFT